MTVLNIDDYIKPGRRAHLVGVGGVSMSPLAEVLHGAGMVITGSDMHDSATVEHLRSLGIHVTVGHRAENVAGAELVIRTAAVHDVNPEIAAAREAGIPVFERAQAWGSIMKHYRNALCISGTHGKTTTTSMAAQILFTAGVDLSAFIGGKLPCIGGSGRAGKSDIMVCESCEFVDTFLKLYPDVAVILNVDADHLDYFGTLENVIKSFHKFAEKASRTVIYNGNDSNTRKAVEGISGKEMITFGNTPDCDYYAAQVQHVSGMETHFIAMHHDKPMGEIVLHVAGIHNVLNAMAAIAAADHAGVPFDAIQKGLCEFRGAGRRFEKVAQVGGITGVDDYAHHPAELTVTLNAAKEMGYRHVWAVFQPFTFSRTAMLLDDFAKALSIADTAVLTDIMGSREKNTYHIFTRNLAEKIPGCVWFPQDETEEPNDTRKYHNFDQVCDYICKHAQPGDLVITLGCGDVYKISRRLAKELPQG